MTTPNSALKGYKVPPGLAQLRQPGRPHDVYQVCMRGKGIVGFVLLQRGEDTLAAARRRIDEAELVAVPYVFLRGRNRCTRESERTERARSVRPVILVCALEEIEAKSAAELAGTLNFTPMAQLPVQGAFLCPPTALLPRGGKGVAVSPMQSDVGRPLAVATRGGKIRPFDRHRFYRDRSRGGARRPGAGGGVRVGVAEEGRQLVENSRARSGTSAGSAAQRAATVAEREKMLLTRRAACELHLRLQGEAAAAATAAAAAERTLN
jgi:hypothetical protein